MVVTPSGYGAFSPSESERVPTTLVPVVEARPGLTVALARPASVGTFRSGGTEMVSGGSTVSPAQGMKSTLSLTLSPRPPSFNSGLEGPVGLPHQLLRASISAEPALKTP